MISINSSPVTQTSGLLTQLFQLETKIVTIGNSYVRLVNGETISSSVVVNVTNDKLSMCRWKFETAIRVGHMTITSELLDVVKNSEVKLTLDGVVLYPDGRESDIRSTKVDVMKKHGKMNLVMDMTNPRTLARCLDPGVVTVRLHLKIEYLDKTIQCLESAMKRFSEKSLKDFSQSMKELLASPSFTNAKIVCGDGVEIAVNKEILANRSPVFEAMFRTDMKEAATGVVDVTDICGKSMKVFVEYLTTGKLDESWKAPDVITDLARAADKYGIESLREFLDPWLGEEDLVRSNLDLLNMVANCGYQKAERKIAVNVARRAKVAKTRDEFLASIGMKRQTINQRRKKLVDNQLKRWMNSQLGDRLTSAESTLELVNLAADEGLDFAETKLVQQLGERLELAQTRDEVLEVLGTQGK